MAALSMDSAEFYDSYVDRQLDVGLNERHRAILRWLEVTGLERGHNVLEIGCGIGTLTQLLIGAVGTTGAVTGIDVSPKSVDVARRRLGERANLTLLAGDVLELELAGTFDVVVMPDVIEHIPLESHPRLFSRAASWLSPRGFVLLNYPNPHYLEWCRQHTPEVLQMIDQPIHADELTANAYPHGLYLDFLKTYSIWIREGDYVVAVLRLRAAAQTFSRVQERRPSIVTRVRRRLPTRRA
jgi:trans-aconitate 2-methyltransferase